MTYAAFCRNKGNHTTPKVGPRNWNKEAMREMVADLGQPWQNLRTESQSQQLEADQLIKTCFEEAISLLGQ